MNVALTGVVAWGTTSETATRSTQALSFFVGQTRKLVGRPGLVLVLQLTSNSVQFKTEVIELHCHWVSWWSSSHWGGRRRYGGCCRPIARRTRSRCGGRGAVQQIKSALVRQQRYISILTSASVRQHQTRLVYIPVVLVIRSSSFAPTPVPALSCHLPLPVPVLVPTCPCLPIALAIADNVGKIFVIILADRRHLVVLLPAVSKPDWGGHQIRTHTGDSPENVLQLFLVRALFQV